MYMMPQIEKARPSGEYETLHAHAMSPIGLRNTTPNSIDDPNPASRNIGAATCCAALSPGGAAGGSGGPPGGRGHPGGDGSSGGADGGAEGGSMRRPTLALPPYSHSSIARKC